MPAPRRILARKDARRLIADGCLAPTSDPQTGLELEFLSFQIRDGARPDRHTLHAIAATPLPSGSRVTCEPGGQLEVSTPPRRSAPRAIDDATADVAELHARAAAASI